MRLRLASPRRAAVLITVLIVVVLLSLAAYKYNDLMSAEYRATDSAFRAAQARAHAISGINFTTALLTNNLADLGGNPWDNAGVFQNVAIPSTDQNARQGRFSILAVVASDDPATSGSQPFRYGVCDEASKINVNALLALDKGKGQMGFQILMDLPNMTEDIANAILDWIDPNNPQRTNGAKDDYYSGLTPAYHCKNGPLDSLEEMLLIKGMTPQLLFGNDKNRNGTLDADEDDGSGQTSIGWSAYLTVYSREVNFDSTGKPRIYLNNQDLDSTANALAPAVGDDLSNFIVAALLYGVSPLPASTSGTAAKAVVASDLSAAQTQIQTDRSSGKKLKKLSSLWSLVNATVSVKVGTGMSQKSISLPSPLNDPGQQADLLAKLFDTCTTSQSLDLMPRLNINTASPTVLQALKDAFNLQDADVQTILSTRPTPATLSSSPTFQSPGWLLTEAKLDLKLIQKLDPFITTRTQVYRFQSVGSTDKGGPTARIEAIIDTNQGRPRIVYYRDLSELGKGFDIAQ